MRAMFLILIALIYAFLLMPMLVVMAASFSAGKIVTFPPEGFSLRWYVQALQSDLFRGAFVQSCLLAGIAALGSATLGGAAAIGLHGAQFRGARLLTGILMSPLVVPGVVIGIALLAGFSHYGPRNSWMRLGLGHLLVTIPYSLRTVLISLQRIDPSLAQAAATLGAGPLRIFREITLPLVRPGMMAGALFAFVMSFDNVPVSIFLAGRDGTTLPLAIMSYLEYNFDPSVAAISTLIILLMVGCSLIMERIAGLRRVLSAS